MDSNKAVIRTMEDALSRGDWDALAATYADVVSHQRVAVTRADFVRVYQDIRQTFPDWITTIDRLIAEDDWVVELMHVTATHLARAAVPHHGDLRGVEPTGRTFEVYQSH